MLNAEEYNYEIVKAKAFALTDINPYPIALLQI